MPDSQISNPHQPSDSKLEIIQRIISATPEQVAAIAGITGVSHTEPPRDFRLYKFSEVSKLLGISRMTLWRMVKQGKIDTVNTSGGNKRIPGPVLHKFICGR